MEAERLDAVANKLTDLEQRIGELRREQSRGEADMSGIWR
jgi:hypothetical protein